MGKLFGFTETSFFTKKVTKLMSDEELSETQQFLCENPDFDKIIQGSSGIRKIRCRMEGTGKRGGARMIYYFAVSREKILLLDVYTKKEKKDLSSDDIKKLRQAVEEFLK